MLDHNIYTWNIIQEHYVLRADKPNSWSWRGCVEPLGSPYYKEETAGDVAMNNRGQLMHQARKWRELKYEPHIWTSRNHLIISPRFVTDQFIAKWGPLKFGQLVWGPKRHPHIWFSKGQKPWNYVHVWHWIGFRPRKVFILQCYSWIGHGL